MAEDSKPRNLFDDFCSVVTEESSEKESTSTELFADASISSGHKDIKHQTEKLKCVTDSIMKNTKNVALNIIHSSSLDEIGSSPKPNNEIPIISSISFVGVEQESERIEGNDIMKLSDNLVGFDDKDVASSKRHAEKNASVIVDIKMGGNNQNIQQEDPSFQENYNLELSTTDVSDYEDESNTKNIPIIEHSKCDDDFDLSGSFLIIDEYKCEENSEEESDKTETVKCKGRKSLETNDSNSQSETISKNEQLCSSSATKKNDNDIQLETVHNNSSESTADDKQIEKNKSNIQSASSPFDTNNQSVANYCDINKQLSKKDKQMEIRYIDKQFESNDDRIKRLERIDTDRVLEAIERQLEKIDKDKLETSNVEKQLETIDSGKPLETSDNDKSLEPNGSDKELITFGKDKQLDTSLSNKPLHVQTDDSNTPLQTNDHNKLLQTNDVDQPLATHASDSDKHSETIDSDKQLTTNISDELLETKVTDKQLETKDIDKLLKTKDVDKPLETKDIDKLLKTKDIDKPLETSDSNKQLTVSCENKQLIVCSENNRLDANDTVSPLKIYVGDKLETNVSNQQTASNVCKDLATSETVKPLETNDCDGEIMTKKEVETIHNDLIQNLGTNYGHEQLETNEIEEQLKTCVTEEQMATCGINKNIVTSDGDKQIKAILMVEQIASICYDNQLETNDSNKSLKTDHRDKQIKTNISDEPLETNDGKNPLETNNSNNPFETNYSADQFETNYSDDRFETDYSDDHIEANNIDKPLETNDSDTDSGSHCKLSDETVCEDKISEICYKNKRSEMSHTDENKHLETNSSEKLLGINNDTDTDSDSNKHPKTSHNESKKHLKTICGEKLLEINDEPSVDRKQGETIGGSKQFVTFDCETTLLSCTKKKDHDKHLGEYQLPKAVLESNDVDDITMLSYTSKCHIIEKVKTMKGPQDSSSENPLFGNIVNDPVEYCFESSNTSSYSSKALESCKNKTHLVINNEVTKTSDLTNEVPEGDHSEVEMVDPNTVAHNSKVSENLENIQEDSVQNYEITKTSDVTNEVPEGDHSEAEMMDPNTVAHNSKVSENLETIQEDSVHNYESMKTGKITEFSDNDHSYAKLADHNTLVDNYKASKNPEHNTLQEYSVISSEATPKNKVTDVPEDDISINSNTELDDLQEDHSSDNPSIGDSENMDEDLERPFCIDFSVEQTGDDQYKCSCGFTETENSFIKHLIIHHLVNKPYRCSYCKICLERKKDMKKHHKEAHQSNPERWTLIGIKKAKHICSVTSQSKSYVHKPSKTSDQIIASKLLHLKSSDDIDTMSSSDRDVVLTNERQSNDNVSKAVTDYIEHHKDRSFGNACINPASSNKRNRLSLNSGSTSSNIKTYQNCESPKSKSYPPQYSQTLDVHCGPHDSVGSLLYVPVSNALYLLPFNSTLVTSTSVVNSIGSKASEAITQTRDHPSAAVASKASESNSHICTTTTGGVAVAESINTNAAASINSSCNISNSDVATSRTAAEHDALENLHAPTVSVNNYGASVNSISEDMGGYNQLLTHNRSLGKPVSLSPNVKTFCEIVEKVTGIFKFLDGHYICFSCHTKWPEKTKFWWHIWFHLHQGKKLCGKCSGDRESLTCSKVKQVMTIIDSVSVDKNNPGQIPLQTTKIQEQNQGNPNFCDASPNTTSSTKVKQDEHILPVVDFIRDQSHQTMTNENHQSLSTSQSMSTTVFNQGNTVNQETYSNEIQTLANKNHQKLSVQHSGYTNRLDTKICSNEIPILENTAPSRTSPEQSTPPTTFYQDMNHTGHQRLLRMSSTLSHKEMFSNENKSTSTQNHQTSPTNRSMDSSEMQIEMNLSEKEVMNSTSLQGIVPQQSGSSKHLINLLSSNGNRNNPSQLTQQTKQQSMFLKGLIQTGSPKIANASSLASQVKSNTSPQGVLPQQSRSSTILIDLLSSNGNGNNHSQFTQQTQQQSMLLNGLIQPESPKIANASSQVENNTSPHGVLHQQSGSSIHLINLLSTNQPVTGNGNNHSVSPVTINQETCSMSIQPLSNSIENRLSIQQPQSEQRLETGTRDTPVNIVKKFIANNGVMNTPKNMTSEAFAKKKLEIASKIKALLQKIREENNKLPIPDPPQNKATRHLMSLDLLSKIMVNAAESSKVSQHSCSDVGGDATPKLVDVTISSEFVVEPDSFVPEKKPIMFKCKPVTKQPQLYACSCCRFSTLLHMKFKKHLLSEHRQRSIMCVHCGFKSKAVEIFIKHLQRHTQPINPRIPAFKCLSKRCLYQCNTLNDFIKHLKTHEDYDHKCHHCDKQFATLEELHQHYKSSFFTIVSCPTCRARSTDKQSILDHISRHHPNKGRMVSVLKQLICKARMENNFGKMVHIQNEWDNPDSDNDDIQILEAIDCETSVSCETHKDLGHQNEEISADLQSDKYSKPALESDKISKQTLESDENDIPCAESDKHISCSSQNGKNANYSSKDLKTNKCCNKNIAENTQQIEPFTLCSEMTEDVEHGEAAVCGNEVNSLSYDFGFKCNFCSFVANRSTSLDNHIAKHNQCQISTYPKDFCCTICPATFNELADLENHLQHHDDKISFTLYGCNVDEYKSNVYSNIMSHLKEHHHVSCDNKDMYSEGTVVLESKVIQCPDCAYKCVNKTVLTEHLKKHNRSRTKKSKSRLPSGTDMVDSDKKVHIVYPASKVNSQNGKDSDMLDSIVSELYKHENCLYLCKVCEKSFKFKKALHVHICYHIDIPFKCVKCAFSAKQLAIVISHVKDEHSVEDVSILFSDKMKDRVKSLLTITKTVDNSINHVDPKPVLKPRRKFFVRGSSGIISITVNKKSEKEYSEQLNSKDNASPNTSVNPERAEGRGMDLVDTSNTEASRSSGSRYQHQLDVDYNSADEELSKNKARKRHNSNNVKTKIPPKSSVDDSSLFMTNIDKITNTSVNPERPNTSVNPERAEGRRMDLVDTSNTEASTSSGLRYQLDVDYNSADEELSKNKARKRHNSNNVKTKIPPKSSVDDSSLFMTNIDKITNTSVNPERPNTSVNPERADGRRMDLVDTSNTEASTSSGLRYQLDVDYNSADQKLSKNKARKRHNSNNVKTKIPPKSSVDDSPLFMTNIDKITQKKSRNKSGKKNETDSESSELIKFDTELKDNEENQKNQKMVPVAKLVSHMKDNSNPQLSSSPHCTLVASPKSSKSTLKKKRCSSPLKLKMNFKLKKKSLLPSNYKCPKCDFMTSFNEEVMKKHLKQHKVESVYECNKCSVKFHSFQQIEIHSNVLHHGDVDFKAVPVLDIPLKGVFKKVKRTLTNKPQTGVNYNSKKETKQIPKVDDEGKADKQSCDIKVQRPQSSFKTALKIVGRSENDTEVSVESSNAMKRKSLGDSEGTTPLLYCETSISNEMSKNKPQADGSKVSISKPKDEPVVDELPNTMTLKRKSHEESEDKAAKRLCTRDGNAAYELCTSGTINEEMMADETGSDVAKEARTKCDEDTTGTPDFATTELSGKKKSHKGDLRPSLFVVKKAVKTKTTASLGQSNMQIGCRYCHKLFTSIFNIAKHVSIRHVGKKVLWTDTLSGCVFNETGTHMKSSENCNHQNKFLCGHCEFRGNTRGSVKYHLKDVHCGNFKNWIKLSGEKEEPSTQPLESKAGPSCDQQTVGIKYKCPVCNYKIGKLDVFSRHLAKHKRFKKISKVWMWKCSSCSLTMAKKKKAEEHSSKCSLQINDSKSIVRLNVIRMVDLKPSLMLSNDVHHLG
ncbi:uncharacterized protein LOC126831632 [Patella vulgata]|uniref:uncharacterized protein LOC126831632 n=1 Tax=Patella vulgata TaxID=6465 RepID=UPI00217F85BB|nr:uncharacterized protein LOC126831632 [Patella vulgata]